MKRKLSKLSQLYAAELQKHLQRGSRASLQPARRLGLQAVTLGLETLDLARIHQGAIAALKTPGNRNKTVQARIFFDEALIPIEKTHQAALRAKAHLNHLHQTLERRTVDLVASNRDLKRSIIGRKTVESALKKSGGHSEKLLQESRRLQRHLKHLTHQILSAHEDKRKKISRNLQDEIAQTLLGINVRLLTLKQDAAVNAESLQKEIASTRRLVDKSMKSIKRFAREFGRYHEE